MTKRTQRRYGALAGAVLLAGAATTLAQVQHGILNVVENDSGNTAASVTLTRSGGYGVWAPVNGEGSNTSRGDYDVDFGTGNDQNLGILIVGPYNDQRTEASASNYFATVAHCRSNNAVPTNRYWVGVFASPGGGEVNYNSTLAYFPIADGWLTGGFYNSTNGGTIDSFVGTPGIVQTNPFDPNGTAGYPSVLIDNANGLFDLRLDGIDMNRDGVLLACGAKNEDNMAMVHVYWDGTARINIRDNGSDGNTAEQDPGVFVFIPDGTPGVVMGRITGSGRALYHQGDFQVAMVGQPDTNGTWRLTIPGESPATGALLTTPYNEFSGNTIDNPVFVVPDDDGWLITSRDIAGMGLQDIDAAQVAFHFAFLKNDVAIYPVAPPKSYLPRLDDIVSARFAVTEYTPGNDNGAMRAERVSGSTALDVFSDNLGDVGISWLMSRPAAYLDNGLDSYEGVWLGNCTQFLRDNAGSGGISGWGTLSFDNGVARTHAASSTGGELNVDFALAFFPRAFGLQQAADVQVASGLTEHIVTIDGDAANDGVCLAMNWDNNNRVVTATPNGNTYVIQSYEGVSGVLSDDWDYGYVYIPYGTRGIISGQVAADGTVLSGTGGFTVGTSVDDLGFAVITVAIPDIDAATDGVLVVTPTSGPYAMSWEVGPNGEFEVAGLDLVSFIPGPAAFSFAYIPNDITCPLCPGDIIPNCLVDIDDATVVLSNMGLFPATARDGDLTGDGQIDLQDIARLQIIFGHTCEELDAAPAAPAPVAPANGVVFSDHSVSLVAHVSDPDGDPVNVSFFGRRLVPNTAEPFTFIALPDTQFYSQDYPAVFNTQAQWILDHIETLNIKYVMHLGDIVNNSAQTAQWLNAQAALGLLDARPDLPVGLTVGNHDQEPCCGGSTGETAHYNTYFPYVHYMGRPWYGGHYGSKNDNSYIRFSAGGMDFVALHFEWDSTPDTAVLNWARGVLATHPNHRAVAVAHYMCGTGNPASFSSQGLALYDAFKSYPGFFLMHGGHIHGEGRRQDTFDGRVAYTLLADYQGRDTGGTGWLRILQFRPADNAIAVSTYSPWLDQYETDADSQFTLDYDMTLSEVEVLGSVTADSSTDATFTWTGLEPGDYEWYVVTENAAGRSRSTTRRFSVSL